jgi:hypothetical protein
MRRLWLPLVGLIAALCAATPASAEIVPFPPIPLIWPARAAIASCATGELTTTASGSDVWAGGWAQPCADSVLTGYEYYTVIYYTSTAGHLARSHLSYYGGLAAPSYFDGELELSYFGRLTAVCLANSPTSRLSCVSIDFPAGYPVTSPIAVNDPRVTVPMATSGQIGEGTDGPYCSNCV